MGGTSLLRQSRRFGYFSDYAEYNASNPVISDDGKFIVFQWPGRARRREMVTEFWFTIFRGHSKRLTVSREKLSETHNDGHR